jgi:hypothetical protein
MSTGISVKNSFEGFSQGVGSATKHCGTDQAGRSFKAFTVEEVSQSYFIADIGKIFWNALTYLYDTVYSIYNAVRGVLIKEGPLGEDAKDESMFTSFDLLKYSFKLSSKFSHAYIDHLQPHSTIDQFSLFEKYCVDHCVAAEGKQANLEEYKLKMLADKTIISFFLHAKGNHWTLVMIDLNKGIVGYYDSKLDYGNYAEIAAALTRVAEQLTQKMGKQFQFVAKLNKSVQPDGYKCGPWVLYFLEEQLNNPNIDFNTLDVTEAQKIIDEYRARVKQEIAKV